MATKIVTKNSSTASAAPTAGDLVQGELAVNVTDKRLYTENNAGAIVELGTNPSTIDINAGTVDGITSLSTSTSGTSNFIAGVNAGNSIASGGNYNTVVGDEAGTAITTGDENVAVGFNSLAAIDTGIHNVSVGSRALQADVKGNY